MTMAEPEELSPLNWYSVKKGQTLLGIARALGVTRADLAAANYLSVRAKLQTGQRLVIPRAPSLLASGTAAQSGGIVAAAAGTSRDTVTPVSYRGGAADQERVMHVVRRGDTLYAIARLYDTTIAQLQRWNRLRGSAIKVGQRLTILGSGTAATN
jgi:membrane-bound lytic murein transglycosylase D